ncbi:MAG: hypothetical protein QF858_01225 [Candidatus Pacebacteria bacterium]|jgi:hypothetical protein|nr:hypothetical protein [Candidatus Paceibacterota bacterium]|tara:strand:- start:21105 stop:21611 length:507 start_codon:yes stop_codon:yes gene_type:complete
MFARIALALSLLLSASAAFAEDYGVCNAEVRYLLSKGGAIAKMTNIKQDRFKFEVVYTHQFGSAETSYSPDWEKLDTPEKRAEAVAKVLAYMDDEEAAVKSGVMYYLVVNRALFPKLKPLFSLSDKPERTTKWRPFVMYVKGEKCEWNSIDIAVFEDDLPEAIRKQLN